MDWSAVIVGALALCGTILSNLISNSKTQWRIEQLEKKQDVHNSLNERVLILEQSQKSAWKSFEEVQKEVKDIRKELYGHE